MSVRTGQATAAAMWVRAKASALLALPFQLGSVVLAFILMSVGAEVEIVLTFVLIFVYWVPLLAELVFRTSIPWALQVSYLIFTVVGAYAGSALHLYWHIPRWDWFVHLYSGIMLAWLGMLFVRRAEDRIGTPMPRWFSVTLILSTSMACAAAWEMGEYLSDQLIGTAAQHGLSDTMADLIAGTLGGIVAIVVLPIIRRPRSLAPASLLATRTDSSTES